MYKENSQVIIEALQKLKAQALRDSSVLLMGICTEVNLLLEPLVVPWSRSDIRRSWEDTRNEAFVCWPEYSGDVTYPVVDLYDRVEFDHYRDKGYPGSLHYWQYNNRALWDGRQLELRLSLIDHCIKFYTALRDS